MSTQRIALLLALGFALGACADGVTAPAPTTAGPAVGTDIDVIRQEVDESLARGKQHESVYEPYLPGSPQRQALDAIAHAKGLVVHSLLSRYDREVFTAMDSALPPGPDDGLQQRRLYDEWCRRGPCLGGERKLGSTPLTRASDKEAVRVLLEGWMGTEPNFGTACVAQYHHAVSFEGDGHAWDVLLCYGCGQYKLLRDGEAVADGQGAHPVGHTVLNQRLAAAGLSYFDADEEAWRGPPLPAGAFEFAAAK